MVNYYIMKLIFNIDISGISFRTLEIRPNFAFKGESDEQDSLG